MEIVFLLLAIGLAGFLLYKPLTKTRKDERDEEYIRRTDELYRQACGVKPFDIDHFVKIANATFKDQKIRLIACELFGKEDMIKPNPPPAIVTGIEGGRYRDYLERYINQARTEDHHQVFIGALVHIFEPLDGVEHEEGMFDAKRRISREEVLGLLMRIHQIEDCFEDARQKLLTNMMENRGTTVMDYKGEDYVRAYLKDTPFAQLEYRHSSVGWNNRAAHTLVLGGSGSGKTTLFKHMIAELLEEDCCVILMDSQSQVIEELAHLKLNEEDMTWVSPEHSLALNPFDIDPEDQKDETVINNKISLLEFVVENLIEAPMTPRQKNLFYYCTQLVLAIPDGNIKTFKEVLEDPFNFSDVIDTLDDTAQDFFFKELRSQTGNRKGNAYDSTRQELSYRLDGLTKQPTFRRIFQTEENTFDFYGEMQERKLILLDTSQALLADGSPTLGRFFIANALQACFQRVRDKETKRPVYFFADEAHEYFDEKLERMLLQARKANVGMVLATQDFSKATKAGIADTLIGSTSTKIVSKVISSDAKRLAPSMKTSGEFLTDLSDHTFALFSGGETVTIQAKRDPFSNFEKHKDLKALRKDMEYHYGPEQEEEETTSDEEATPSEETDKTKVTKPASNTSKPKSSKQKPAMSKNEDQDITPSDQL